MKKQKVTKRLFLIIGIILVIIIALIAYLVVEDLKQEDLLKKEIINISNKELLIDDFSVEVQTTGDYAYIEEAIKTYYKDLSTNIKLMNSYLNNQELIQILSATNIKNDGPKFENSYQILNEATKNSTNALQTIINLCNEETIKNLIDKDKVDDYSYELYLDLMYTKEDLKYFKETQTEMQTLSNNLNTFFTKVEAILKFLETNSTSWYIENEQLYFQSDALLTQYNNLSNDLNNFVEENFTLPTNSSTTTSTAKNHI